MKLFLYSFFFAVLAYPPSGTPFADHHATFLSLLGIYCFILALNSKRNFYWIFMPIFFGLSFFSKQVPGSYIIVPLGIIIIFYSIIRKKLNPIKYSFIGFLIFILKEIITKLTISLNINFIIAYIVIFFTPFIIGLYQVIKIEND